jgi:chaperonin GroEL
VPGGGVALVRCIPALDKVEAKPAKKKRRAPAQARPEEPLAPDCHQCRLEGSVVANKVMEGKDDFGFNADTEASLKT